jgi:hypothetical protein
MTFYLLLVSLRSARNWVGMARCAAPCPMDGPGRRWTGAPSLSFPGAGIDVGQPGRQRERPDHDGGSRRCGSPKRLSHLLDFGAIVGNAVNCAARATDRPFFGRGRGHAAGMVVPLASRAYAGPRRWRLAGGAAAGLGLGLAPLPWSQAVITGVHALQTLLLAVRLWMLSLSGVPSPSRLAHGAAGLAVWLALGNHLTSAMLPIFRWRRARSLRCVGVMRGHLMVGGGWCRARPSAAWRLGWRQTLSVGAFKMGRAVRGPIRLVGKGDRAGGAILCGLKDGASQRSQLRFRGGGSCLRGMYGL